MKGAIIFKSHYGATRKYAEMLSGEFNIPVIPAAAVNSDIICQYDYLLIGTPVYIGKLLLKKFLQLYASELSTKKLFLFIVCGDACSDEVVQHQIISNNVPEIIVPNTRVFFLRGKVVFKELSLQHKILLRLGAMMQKSPEKKHEMSTDFNDVKKENVRALADAIKEFTSNQKQAISN
ncbi:flavodoxin domain-containing protein [Flavitalea antarctica]